MSWASSLYNGFGYQAQRLGFVQMHRLPKGEQPQGHLPAADVNEAVKRAPSRHPEAHVVVHEGDAPCVRPDAEIS